jgi:ferredoxin
MAFLSELSAFGDRVHLHFDDEAGGVMDLAAIVSAASPQAHLYGCGPAPMLAAFSAAAEGRDPATVHLEHFGAVQAAAVEGGYVVQLARSGVELPVPPGSSLLDALTAHGIAVESSCREGICGCCEVAVLEGEVDHRDAVLSESERAAHRTMMVCCSGARSARLVLDL